MSFRIFVLAPALSLMACAVPSAGPDAGFAVDDMGDGGDVEADADAADADGGDAEVPSELPTAFRADPDPFADHDGLSSDESLLVPCGLGVFCSDTRISAQDACVRAARANYAEYERHERFVLGCEPFEDVSSESFDDGAEVEVELFHLEVADVDAPVTGVVTEADGTRWVFPMMELLDSINVDERIEAFEVYVRREDGRLRLEARLGSRVHMGSCVEHDRYWEEERTDAIFCGEDASGAFACTGRIPRRVVGWEIRIDTDDGIEIGRRRITYLGLRPEWRGDRVHITRRPGRLTAPYRAALGTHTIEELRPLMLRGKYF